MAIEVTNNILDYLQPQEILDYVEDTPKSFNLLEKYFPVRKTQAEELIIEDETTDYNPSAIATAENAVGPNAQRVATGKKVQDFDEYQLEYKLTKKEIRKLNNPANSAERDEYLDKIYRDGERLLNGHDIVQERLRAMALYKGINELKENNVHIGPIDYGVPKDQFLDFDLANEDFLEFFLKQNEIVSERTSRNIGNMILTRQKVFELMNNPSLKLAYWGSSNYQDRRLKESELRDALLEFCGITMDIIENPDRTPYMYSLDTKTKSLFIPKDIVIFTPSGALGETVHAPTAEELKIGEAGIEGVEKYKNTILYTQYITRPLNYIMSSISRFTITYPKAPSSIIITDKEGAKGTQTKN